MKEKLELLKSEALSAVANATDEKAIDEVRVKYLGKKGELTAILKGLGSLTPDERKAVGQAANEARAIIEEALNTKNAARNLEATAHQVLRLIK